MQIGSKDKRNSSPWFCGTVKKKSLMTLALLFRLKRSSISTNYTISTLPSPRALQEDRLRSLTSVTLRCLCSSHPPAASNLSMSLAQQVVSLIPRRASPKPRLAEEFVFIKIQPTITILSDGEGFKCACPAILAAVFLQGKGSSATCLFTF